MVNAKHFEIETDSDGSLILCCGNRGMITDLVFSAGAMKGDPDLEDQREIMEFICKLANWHESIKSSPEPKQITVERLQKQISKHQSEQSRYETEINDLKKEILLIREAEKPLKDSLSKLTSERGKWLRKLKRAGVKA